MRWLILLTALLSPPGPSSGCLPPPPPGSLPTIPPMIPAPIHWVTSGTSQFLLQGTFFLVLPSGTDTSDAYAESSTLRTSWTDTSGVFHEVVTQVTSVDDGAARKALDEHDKLVAGMQKKYKPAPPPQSSP